MLADRGRQPHRQLDREYRGRLGNPDPARCHRLVRVPAGLPLRAAEPAGQLTGGLGHRDTSLHQLSGRVDAQRVLTAASTSTSHVINVLPGMSLPGRAAPGPFQPPVAESDVEAEVIYCVGGVVSPVLSNIYLDRLDTYIEQTLLPAHNRGARRTPYRPYMGLWQRAWRLEQQGDREAGRTLRKQMKTMPSRNPGDPGYRRLLYCRYADDWLLGFTGPRQEAEQIKARIGEFLHDQLKLELSPAKTLITHGRTQAARFLGYQIVVLHADHKHDQRGHRSINAGIGLKVPADVIRAKCAPYLHHGKPIRRTERIVDTDFSIVAQFQAEFRGVAEYYRLAFNRHRLGRLKYVMERSLTKTLARKYRIRAAQVYRRYRAVLDTGHGPRRGLQVTVHRDGGRPPLVAQWGGISLARDTTPAILNDNPPRIWSNRRSELVQRLLADACEQCGSGDQVEVHHIRALKDLNPKGRKHQPEWATRMAARRRKTLVVCRVCHEDIHAGRPARRSR